MMLIRRSRSQARVEAELLDQSVRFFRSLGGSVTLNFAWCTFAATSAFDLRRCFASRKRDVLAISPSQFPSVVLYLFVGQEVFDAAGTWSSTFTSSDW
ncbi:hypothetical protein WA026_005406 [Henosepilachna vigintioctopunctata]|uniref:Uncharacterized protein n=1 Tax=Henosepilachna vigintioctopunctata TaxID=420089 RepID=A0AAW1U0U8_9CUCU